MPLAARRRRAWRTEALRAVRDDISTYLMSTGNPSDSQAAYTAPLEFKKVVK